MFKRWIGFILVLIGAIGLVVNVSFFKGSEYYDVIRVISVILFLGGGLFIPEYLRTDKKQEDQIDSISCFPCSIHSTCALFP
ncbi:hypothetical protein KV679_00735 [Bacillus sp. JRC01]|nr:hypothetical protein [Bacillus sp. JRC01]